MSPAEASAPIHDFGPGDTILITGAGSGLGLECALHLAEQGYRVFGSVLSDAEANVLRGQAQTRNVGIELVKMDVTDDQQVRSCVQRILHEVGRLDGLVHFAGLGLRGFFEDLSLSEIRRVFDVNVFGTMAVTQAVLPHMREAKRGRIILTSSAAGRMGSMSIGGYASSKFAVEGFAECLKQEVAPFGIYVSLLEPGLIATPHFTINRNRARRAMDPGSPYYKWFCQHEKIVDNMIERQSFTSADVARVVHNILTARKPKLRYMIGWKVQVILSMRRYIPGEWFESAYWSVVRRMVTRPRTATTTLSGNDS